MPFHVNILMYLAQISTTWKALVTLSSDADAFKFDIFPRHRRLSMSPLINLDLSGYRNPLQELIIRYAAGIPKRGIVWELLWVIL